MALLLYVDDLINYDDLNFNDKKSISKQMELEKIFLCVCLIEKKRVNF